MNGNIEVINENLWAVNQYFVKEGYIQELETLPECYPEKEDACLTTDGILILNKDSPVYEVCKNLMIRIMSYSDATLKDIFEIMSAVEKPDPYEFLYCGVIGWEIKRRKVKTEYIENHTKNKRKKVMVWLRFKLV